MFQSSDDTSSISKPPIFLFRQNPILFLSQDKKLYKLTSNALPRVPNIRFYETYLVHIFQDFLIFEFLDLKSQPKQFGKILIALLFLDKGRASTISYTATRTQVPFFILAQTSQIHSYMNFEAKRVAQFDLSVEQIENINDWLVVISRFPSYTKHAMLLPVVHKSQAYSAIDHVGLKG